VISRITMIKAAVNSPP